jgi:serine/threonine protein kinase
MNRVNNSDDQGVGRHCPKCNFLIEFSNDTICSQCKKLVGESNESIKATYQTTQVYEQTKEAAESQQDPNTLLFATLPIEKVNQPESEKTKQTPRLIWEKKASEPGASMGNYHRMELVAHWRFGSIYAAEHILLRNKVRLITLDSTNEENDCLKTWFLETAEVMARIDHQNIDEYVLDHGQIEGKAYVCISEQTHDSNQYLSDYATNPRLNEAKENLSIVLSSLVRGLNSLHSLGLLHGSINQKHIRQGKTPEAAVFCPFATGFPGENLVDQSGKISQNIRSCKRQDFRDLMVAYIQELQGEKPTPIPKLVNKKWLHKQFPAIAPKLADVLTKLRWIGTSTKDVQEILDKLGQISNSPLRKITWTERSYGVLTDFLTLFLFSVPVWLPALFVMGGIKTEYRLIPLIIAIVLISIPLIIWEPLFNSTIGKKGEYFLIDSNGGIPSSRRRLARSITRLASWFLLSAIPFGVILLIVGVKRSDENGGFEYYQSLSKLTYHSFLIGLAMVYAISLFLRGETFHDWITKTFWVTYRSSTKTSVLKHHISDVLGLKNKPVRSVSQLEHGPSVVEVDGITVGAIIGRGGMGVVYQGWDKRVKRPVAIKLISNTKSVTDEAIQRFRREAEIGSNLSHPNVAKVYSVGHLENHPYILLEYVDGETLNEIVKRYGPIPPVIAWQIIRQTANALQATTNLGIVHRDIKPANIMLTRQGIVKVMDFGVSSLSVDSAVMEEGGAVKSAVDRNHPLYEQEHLTRTGIVLGTPQYMSPEQIKGERVDCRSDIYSLGLTLYTLLSGKPAFEGANQESFLKQCTDMPPRLKLREFGSDQHRVLEKMLAKNKEDRYQNFNDVLVDLDLNEPEEAHFPDGRDRAAAFFIDMYVCVVIISYIDIISQPESFIRSIYNGSWSAFLLSALPVFLVKVLFCGLYFGFSNLRYGGTPGQQLFRLKVFPKNGHSLQPKKLVLRSCIQGFLVCLGYLFFNAFSQPFLDRDLGRPFFLRFIVHFPFVTVFAFFFFLLPLSTAVIFSAAAHYSRNDFRTLLDRLTGTRVVKTPRRKASFSLHGLFFRRSKK